MTRSSQAQAVRQAVSTLDHPTADDIFMHVRQNEARVSIGTVYRNLDRLVADGRLRVRQIGGQRRYDTNLDAHAHLHCTRCERLMDVPWDPYETTRLRTQAERHGFLVEDQILEVQGVCPECRETERRHDLSNRK